MSLISFALLIINCTSPENTFPCHSSSSGVGGSGGKNIGCTAKITCESIGAECGTIQDDGCGNTINCTNLCSAPFTCGGGSNQFHCGCTPKTCEELGKNCGLTDDSCNGTINCGSCDPNKYQTTCGNDWIDVDNKLAPPEPNVCGGGCGRFTVGGGSGTCTNMIGHTVEWLCDSNVTPTNPIPPSTNCILPFNGYPWTWCCSN